MKDKDGFRIPCIYESWEIYNEREDKDFICRGNSPCYGWFCDQNEKCRGYEPDIRKNKGEGD